METVTLGRVPINEASPAGEDVRYELEFEELQAEIDKLSLASESGSPIDWHKVSDLAAGILEKRSKDLLVAAYFGVAQIHLAGLEGLFAGIRVYSDLLENYWDSLFPKKKRMRGRVAAAEWWLERSVAAAERLGQQVATAEVKATLLEQCEQLNRLVQERFPEPPSLSSLITIINQIPAEVARDAEDVVEVIEVVEELSAEQPVRPDPARAETSPADIPLKEVLGPKTKSVPEQQDSVREVASAEDALHSMRAAYERMQRAALFLVEHNPTEPTGHRALRQALWAELDVLPPAVEQKTIIPPPEPYVLTTLQDLTARGDWINLAAVAALRSSQYLFWLDLQRYCAIGLEKLGVRYADAYDAVCQETATLLRRLPGVTELQFADGTPFADQETKEWCQGLNAGSMDLMASFQAVGSEAAQEDLHDAVAQAQALLKGHNLIDGVRILQKGMQDAVSGKEGMQWRLALIQLLLEGKSARTAYAHCQVLVEDIERYQLEIWDPAQAVLIYTLCCHCLKAVSAKLFKERSREFMDRIARLNPAEALLLDS
ncbi:MAG: type VI secretion system protein TssA [Candidatus Electrothrix sp. GW3-4]|uniref:type VI secretion system protein TssA n=1 Tax=Candidatus Electrothrix sp. GW3-4 TaxID=3126740 RepID=UPI0030CB635E